MVADQNLSFTKWTKLSSSIATFMFIWSIFQKWSVLQNFVPYELRQFISRYRRQFFETLSPYVHLIIDEYANDRLYSGKEIYRCARAYLDEHGCKNPKRFRLHAPAKGDRVFRMTEGEEVTDRYKDVTVWWELRFKDLAYHTRVYYYKLVFHRKYKEKVRGEYLEHVINHGKMIIEKRKIQKLWLNRSMNSRGQETPPSWTSVQFDHPATFEKLATDPAKKKEIVEDLLKFTRSKDFYARVGKAWKRGYLLYGPPGTGKSTMIAAMANLLGYDVYDLELTGVRSNEQLRRLLINTTKRSIIAIEDIDCSLDITGQRDMNVIKKDKSDGSPDGANSKSQSSVTLSGLLNFIDGLWSSSEGERIIVFTTNSLSKLDPALIRTGRMDKHIEMSYCCFEGFRVLAKNYLLIEEHPKFKLVKCLLETTKMTPADVGENLMPKFPDEDAEACLNNLVRALEKAKEDQTAKAALLEKAKEDEAIKAQTLKLDESMKKQKAEELRKLDSNV